MKKEKIILALIAATGGLIIAAVAFFFYQKTKAIPPSQVHKITVTTPTPSANTSLLTIDKPTDEQVVSSASIAVSGATDPKAKVLIVTGSTQEAATPNADGRFQTDIPLEAGENLIKVIAILPTGENVVVSKTVTYSTESF